VALSALPAVAKPKAKGPKRTPTAVMPAIISKIIVDADADPSSGPPPLKVQFNVDVHDPESLPDLRFEWDFGDGSPKVKESKPVHVYKKAGNYKVIVRASDSVGESGTDEVDVEVEAPE
jgi:PKD repeat protein